MVKRSTASSGSPSLDELRDGKNSKEAQEAERLSPESAESGKIEDTGNDPAEGSPLEGTLGESIDFPVPGTDAVDAASAEKICVKTTGDFMVHDPFTSNGVDPGKCGSMVKTSFVMSKIDAKQLEECACDENEGEEESE